MGLRPVDIAQLHDKAFHCAYGWVHTKDTIEEMNEKASKLSETRSRLYRRRFLQPITQFSAVFENYTIYVVLHRSHLKISENICHQISANEKNETHEIL